MLFAPTFTHNEKRVLWGTRLIWIVLCVVVVAQAQIGSGVGGGMGAGYPVGPESAPVPGSPQVTAKYSVSGTVLNAVTGAPIAHALVRVVVGSTPIAMFTDDNGGFTVNDLTQGAGAMVLANKPGFFDRSNSDSGTVSPVMVGPDARPVRIELMPMATISGVVLDDEGDPVPGAVVSSRCMRIVDGRKQWQQCGATGTNEDGEFRLPHLLAGSYTLTASVTRRERITAAGNTEIHMGYAPAHYPPDAGGSSMRTFDVRPGARKQVAFTLRKTRVYDVYGNVVGLRANAGASMELLSANRDPLPTDVRLEGESGTFVIHNVAAGQYVVRATSSDEHGHPVSAEVPVTVSSDVAGVTLSLRASINIAVNINAQLTHDPAANRVAFIAMPNNTLPPVPIWANACLRSVDRQEGTYCSSWDTNGDAPMMEIKGVQPGRYVVEVQPMGALYAADASYDGNDVLNDVIEVKPGASAPLEVTVRDDGATLTCSTQAKEGISRATLLVISDDGHWAKRMPLGAGEIRLDSLPPGDYKLYAFDEVDGLEYMNPDVMSDYATNAVAVTLAPNEKKSVKLDVIARGMK